MNEIKNLPKFKKQRDNARNQLNEVVNRLCAEFGLNQYEVLHAIVDKAQQDIQTRVAQYPTVYPATIRPGLAETYLPHTTQTAEQWMAEFGEGSAEPAAKKKKAGLGKLMSAPSPWSWDLSILDDPVSPGPSKDELYAAAYGGITQGPEKVALKITKNKSDWVGHPFQPKATVGGTIAASTVEKYGYELPKGYVFVPTAWGGEYTVEKEVKTYAVLNTAGFTVDIPLGQYLTKEWMQHFGVWDLNLPGGVGWSGPGPNGSWALTYKGEGKPPMHEPLDLEPAQKPSIPLSGHWCGTKGCLDVTLYPGENTTITGQLLASKGLNYSKLSNLGPKGFVITKQPMMDLVNVSYPA